MIVINSIQFKIISNSAKKIDEHDTEMIAKYLSKELMSTFRVKSNKQAQLTSLIGTRSKFIKLRSTLKNKIHNILHANGIVTKKESFSSEKSLNSILTIEIEEIYKFELKIIGGGYNEENSAFNDFYLFTSFFCLC
ncbi:MAG TPA: transposase [Thermodesulfovibrio thiophilus]|uniref:IS110 family transposase n=1 Tax=Thermodesulfovibrio thiophilus TaxID=340095 RepID=UPI00181D272E|nr:IS110 family transposase [Thermodesulfovibrio thiophilus]HQD37074.1 transposase [Thermodesulfovibrio thiophilus]